MATADLTAARVREVLDYNSSTGAFTWKVRLSNRATVGDVAGTINGTGYRYISVDGRRFRAHRMAWLFVHGEMPAHDVDHINGVRDDNRIDNLRAVTRSVNQQNLRASRGDTRSGELGVAWSDHRKKWRAHIKSDGRYKHLGYRDTVAEAKALYVEAKRRLHEGCTI